MLHSAIARNKTAGKNVYYEKSHSYHLSLIYHDLAFCNNSYVSVNNYLDVAVSADLYNPLLILALYKSVVLPSSDISCYLYNVHKAGFNRVLNILCIYNWELTFTALNTNSDTNVFDAVHFAVISYISKLFFTVVDFFSKCLKKLVFNYKYCSLKTQTIADNP